MKKNGNSRSLMSMYSDNKGIRKRKTSKEDLPPMTTYEQRFKGGSMTKDVTEDKIKTLNDKIEARKKLSEPVNQLQPKRVSVEIAGSRYLLGSNEEMSEQRIKRIASKVNTILSNAKDNNPGLTNSKINALALLDACDRILTLKDENSNMRTELMYYQQKVNIEEEKDRPEPTPMELLANETED